MTDTEDELERLKYEYKQSIEHTQWLAEQTPHLMNQAVVDLPEMPTKMPLPSPGSSVSD